MAEGHRASRAFGGAMPSTGFDFQMTSGTTPALIVALQPGMTFFSEGGALVCKDSDLSLKLGLGNGARQGFLGKVWSAVRRRMSGEGFLTQQFVNATQTNRSLILAAPRPGDILAVDLNKFGGSVLCQRGAFMAAPGGTDVTIHLKQKIGFALFGQEHLVMQQIRGDNVVFLNAGGSIVTRALPPGKAVDIDTGCLVAMTPNVGTGIVKAGSWASSLFGSEGFFMVRCSNASAEPGRVWMQTSTFSREVAAITAEQARQSGKRSSIMGNDPG